jgi:outer membrane protein
MANTSKAMPMIKQFLILVTILSAATLTAQNQWTVKQCIDHAMQNNIQVKLNQLNEESNQLTVSQNYASFLPDI